MNSSYEHPISTQNMQKCSFHLLISTLKETNYSSYSLVHLKKFFFFKSESILLTSSWSNATTATAETMAVCTVCWTVCIIGSAHFLPFNLIKSGSYFCARCASFSRQVTTVFTGVVQFLWIILCFMPFKSTTVSFALVSHDSRWTSLIWHAVN